MTRRLVLSLAALLCFAGSAAAQQPASMDPQLRAFLRPEIRRSVEQEFRIMGPPTDSTPTPGLRTSLALSPSTTGAPEVGVFLQMRDAGGLSALQSAGASIRAVTGDLVAARVPLAALDGLATSGHFSRIEAAHRVKLDDDSSTVAEDAQNVREVVNANGGWVGFAGTGVIVGTYDTGIDFRHPDFLTPGGKARVIGIWDQTVPGTPPSGFTFGNYCDSAAIESAVEGQSTCSEVDSEGHGSHVAGIAAGDGSANANGPSTYIYAGVAPEADILTVKGGNYSFYEDNIIAGLEWLKQRAQALGRPAVVNLSLGSQYGPHDGSRLYERMIDSLSGPGFIVAVAAGNEGSNHNASPPQDLPLIHASGTPVAGVQQNFSVVIPQYTPSSNTCNDYTLLDLWYNGSDRFTVVIHRPDGSAATVAFGDTAESASPDGNVFLDNASTGPDPENGENETYIELSGCAGSGSPQPGTWTVSVVPSSPASGQAYDMWITDSALGASGASAYGGSGFDNRSTVSSPGTATRAITVGAFTTRNCLPGSSGEVCDAVTDPVGDITFFSGTGPTRDGRLKPDLAAPGRYIISTLSENATGFAAAEINPDGRHVALQGTSMSTPAVTGATALLLEVDPTLTPEAAKDIYDRSDRQDAFTAHSYVQGDPGGVPNDTWGYGKLDVQAALTAMGATHNASTLALAADALATSDTVSSRQGTLAPLLRVNLSAAGPEPVAVRQLGFVASGGDPAATVVLVRDANGNGIIDPTDPVLARSAMSSSSDTILVASDSLMVPANGALSLLAAVQMSGQAPNGSGLTLNYLPGELRSEGSTSHVAWLVNQPTTTVASNQLQTTVLSAGEVFAMSENPIRSSHVIFNFKQTPTLAAVYTLSGRRVVDLRGRMTDPFRADWDLTNDSGGVVAPGIYLLVVEVSGQRITKKLFITGERSSGGAQD